MGFSLSISTDTPLSVTSWSCLRTVNDFVLRPRCLLTVMDIKYADTAHKMIIDETVEDFLDIFDF